MSKPKACNFAIIRLRGKEWVILEIKSHSPWVVPSGSWILETISWMVLGVYSSCNDWFFMSVSNNKRILATLESNVTNTIRWSFELQYFYFCRTNTIAFFTYISHLPPLIPQSRRQNHLDLSSQSLFSNSYRSIWILWLCKRNHPGF